MRIHILSDLHLEVAPFRPQRVECDLVVLAGDISKGSHGIEWARQTWPNKEILFVPGNHEFFNFKAERAEILNQMRLKAKTNGIHFLDNDEITLYGIRFLGATLWTDFNLFGEGSLKTAMVQAASFLPDFKEIRTGGKLFTPSDSIELHKSSVSWLAGKLNEPTNQGTVVISHHLPALQSIPERFKTSMLSASFASYLNDLMGKSELWIHGHAHDSADYFLNGTRVVCNPRGYAKTPGTQENRAFNSSLVVEI